MVLAIGLLITVAMSFFVTQSAQTQEQMRFDSADRNAREAIQTRIDTYVALLRAEAGLFVAAGEVTREQFRAFAERLGLRERYPGIQGLGFTVRVAAADLPALVARMRAEGVPDFRVWPDTPRPEYHSIVYLEPLDARNAAAIGFDMFTDATRRAAMEQAARSGTAAASGKVTLVQEIEPEKQPGFLIYVPVYAKNRPARTDAERVAALRGFVYSPFRAGDLLSKVFPGDSERDIDVQVFDLYRGRTESLLFDSAAKDGLHRPRFLKATRIEIAGRPWWLVASSRPTLENSPERRMALWTLAGGLALSLALFALVLAEVRARSAAERAAESLHQSQAALHASAEELQRVVSAEREAHADAAEANRLKDEFLATLSHELRTPLNAILGWVTMLRGGRLSPAQQERALEVIERNARSQTELVDDLLEVSRIITGKLRIDLRPTDLASAAEAAVDSVRPIAEAKGVTLEWQRRSLGLVLGDPDRLQQVAWNLLSNALKFTPSGGRVTAEVTAHETCAELVVADTGVGIAPEFLPHVFERFRQGDSSTTRNHGGLGLGLAIVRHLVEAHGGTVRVESAGHGAGATFVVRLPLRAASTAARAVEEHQQEPVASRGLSRATVLVLDDDADARDLIETIVRGAGGEPVLASSVGEALHSLRSRPVDLVIADIGMPGRDGLDFIREVRALPVEAGGSVPAIALTAYGRPEDRQRALAAGYQAHLVKPARPEAIVAAAEELLRGR